MDKVQLFLQEISILREVTIIKCIKVIVYNTFIGYKKKQFLVLMIDNYCSTLILLTLYKGNQSWFTEGAKAEL